MQLRRLTELEVKIAALRLAKLIPRDVDAFFSAVEIEPLEVLEQLADLLDRVSLRYARSGRFGAVEALFPYVERVKMEPELRRQRFLN